MTNLGPNFYPKLVKISSELGIKPEDLLVVMVSESGLNPSSVEQKFHGSGLVGFMPDTLKGLGYAGSWEDFVKLTGADQLDYVKKLVQNNMKLNDGPFTSAAQYYVANLWPVALKLPGIRKNDPSTAFIEEHPATVADTKTGKKYSKKYYDLGFHISPEMESAAYKYNPLFHGTTPGAITYQDMIKQADKIKNNPIYQKALLDMKNATGYQAHHSKDLFKKYISQMKDKNIYDSLIDGSKSVSTNVDEVSSILTNYLNKITTAEKNNKSLYKKYLPKNNILITVGSDDYTNSIEFSRILCLALDEELLSKSYIHTNGSQIDIECEIFGPKEKCFDVVKQLSISTAEAFKLATKKIGGIDVYFNFVMDKKSSFNPIGFEKASSQYRKFLLKFN